MNAKITLNAPLVVSTDPVTGNITAYHSIEDFTTGCIDERNLKVKPESYICSKLPDYNCEECTVLPYVNPEQLSKVVGYAIKGIAKKYDTDQTPHKEIDSKEISFSIGKAGVIASNTNNKCMPYVLGTDNIDLFVQLAKAGEAIVLHKDIDAAYQIINNGMPETIFRMMVGFNLSQQDQDLFVQVNDSFKTLPPNQIKQFFLDKKQQVIKSIESGLVVQQQAEADPLDNDILRLANLPELQYEQTRTAEAEQLGIRASVLDKLVKAKRKEIAENKHRDDFFEHVEAWHTAVNGHELLNSIEQVINNHIACEPQTRTASALWILYTWAIDAMQIAPIACITAPEKRCGKTQLLTLIGELCYKPLPTSNISSPAMYRAIEEWKPTLLIDEADTFLKENEDLRGVINAGHSRKNAFVVRCDGDDNKPKRFNVYCAKAISGIGHLPETIKDRSIILELRRKLPSEQKLRLRHADQAEWHNVRRKCLRWVNDNFESIKTTRPQLPEQLHDRAQDNWESLFIIAQLASDEWLEKANHAALQIDGAEIASLSVNEQLLTDIKQIFGQHGHKNMFSSGLVDALNADEENTWATWNRGKPITQNQLATRLKFFGIKSKKVRIGTVVKSGYELSQFDDAFKRYIHDAGIQNVTTLQPTSHKAYSENQSVTQKNDVTFQKPLKPTPHKDCNDVTFQNGVTGDEQHCNEVTTPKKQVKAKASPPKEVIDTKTLDMFGGGI